MIVIKKLIQFLLKYLTDKNFRNLCDTMMSTGIDSPIFGAEARSPQWNKVRNQHLKEQSSCQVCGTKEDLNVHHIVPFHIDPSKELAASNLITLCEHNKCHFTFGHLYNWSSYNPEVVKDTQNFKNKVQNRS